MVRAGQPGQDRQDSLDRTAWTGQPGQDSQDRKVRTGLSEYYSMDRTAETRQPRLDSHTRPPEQQGQDILKMTAGTGLSGFLRLYRTERTCWLNKDRTAG
jgi:hypothetical protein